jgi:hypothetical protein
MPGRFKITGPQVFLSDGLYTTLTRPLLGEGVPCAYRRVRSGLLIAVSVYLAGRLCQQVLSGVRRTASADADFTAV